MENEKTEIISAKYITEQTNHMEYQPGMDNIGSEVQDEVISRMNAYDADAYTAADVLRALRKDVLSPEDFGALLSPAALPFLEQMAQRAQAETRKHFGNSVQMFTPLYIANYCENYCIYCGFNCHNKIRRAKLDMDEVEQELKAIAETGLQEILILTGESRAMSPTSVKPLSWRASISVSSASRFIRLTWMSTLICTSAVWTTSPYFRRPMTTRSTKPCTSAVTSAFSRIA